MDKRALFGLGGFEGYTWKPDSMDAKEYADALNANQGLTDELDSMGWGNDLTVFVDAGQRRAFVEFHDADYEDLVDCLALANQIARHIRGVAA